MKQKRRRKRGKTAKKPRVDPKSSPSTSAPKWSLWKYGLFLVAATAGILVVLEGVLAFAGVRPALQDEDPYVGFSSRIPLFVSERDDDGVEYLVTAPNKQPIFNPQRFPRAKAPNTHRVFCVGGSTTFGKPYDDPTSFCGWLRAMLPEADPTRQWEVINAGGISYASYRVVTLMEELIAHEPDLFIVYTGQNEFLEQRTYGGSGAGAVRAVRGALSHTRTFTLAKRAQERVSGRSAPLKDAQNMLPAEVDTILDHSVGPEAYHRDDKLRDQILEHFAYNLNRMVDVARSVDAEIVFVVPGSNLRDCAPFKSEHGGGLGPGDVDQWNAMFQQAENDYRAGRFDKALELLDEATCLNPRHAGAHFLRGRALWELGRFDDAEEAFVLARDEDVCPLRALTLMGEMVGQVAEERGAPLADFEALAETLSDHDMPGDDVFLDHVHPTIESHRQLALALLGTMKEQGILEPAPTWDAGAIERVRVDVESQLDEMAHGIALRNLARVIGWAGKQAEAREIALKAVEMAPTDAEAYFVVAVNAENLGRKDEAERYYRLAMHTELDQKIALFRNVVETESADARTHYDLGAALVMSGELEGVQEYFREALRLDPKFVPALDGLAWILATHPDKKQQDVPEAIELAKRAVELTQSRNASTLDTLAMAHAMAGNFDQAVPLAQQALELATAHRSRHVRAIQTRLSLYQRAGQRQRVTVPAPGG